MTDLHGGPVYQHSHEFDLDARLYAAAGYAVLALNPRGSSGRGFDFSRAIYADWGNLDVKDISAGITHAIDAGFADPQRIGVGGWSYGGILTDYMIASDPRIKAAVSGAGVANVLATFGVDMYAREYVYELGTPWEHFDTWTRLAYPFLHPERITASTLFQCAGADDNVPCVGAQQMYLALKTRGVPDPSHRVPRREPRAHRAELPRAPHAQQHRVVRSLAREIARLVPRRRAALR